MTGLVNFNQFFSVMWLGVVKSQCEPEPTRDVVDADSDGQAHANGRVVESAHEGSKALLNVGWSTVRW